MKNLPKTRVGTITNAVDAITTQPPQLQTAVENSAEVPPPKPEREKFVLTQLRLNEDFLTRLHEEARKHNVALKSYLQLSLLSMRDATEEEILDACNTLRLTVQGAELARATIKSSERFSEGVLRDMADRFGNLSLAFKASAAYMASLSETKQAKRMKDAIQSDRTMKYSLLAMPKG